MTEYYRGANRKHATFWVKYRDLPRGERFAAYIDFLRHIESEMRKGDCSLREAGYALEPGYYDQAIQAAPHGGDMTILCLRASDLASWIYGNHEEAEEDWAQIVGIMQKY